MSMIFALVLFGCADDGSDCRRLDAASAHYGSKALCEAGAETALQSDTAMRSDFPLVISRCLRKGAAR